MKIKTKIFALFFTLILIVIILTLIFSKQISSLSLIVSNLANNSILIKDKLSKVDEILESQKNNLLVYLKDNSEISKNNFILLSRESALLKQDFLKILSDKESKKIVSEVFNEFKVLNELGKETIKFVDLSLEDYELINDFILILEDIKDENFNEQLSNKKEISNLLLSFKFLIIKYINSLNSSIERIEGSEEINGLKDELEILIKSLKLKSKSSKNKKNYDSFLINLKEAFLVFERLEKNLETRDINFEKFSEKKINLENNFYKKIGKKANKIVENSKKESTEMLKFTKTSVLIIILLSIILTLIIFILIRIVITQPLSKITLAANKIEEGNFNIDLQMNSSDEIGEVSKAFNNMSSKISSSLIELKNEKESIEQKVKEAIEKSESEKKYLTESTNKMLQVMEKFAKGDLTVFLDVEDDDEIGQLYFGFNQAVENINQLVIEIIEAVDITADTANLISSSMEELSITLNEQNQLIDVISESIKKITSSLDESVKNVNDVEQNSNLASEKANLGEKSVELANESSLKISVAAKETVEKIKYLTKNTRKINKVISVINDIAEQTNFLALNASIEASKAGEFGKGFDVVANEIRNLSKNTSSSTKEIFETIKIVQNQVEETNSVIKNFGFIVDNGLNANQEVKLSFGNILSSSKNVSQMVVNLVNSSETQYSESKEISNNVLFIKSGINESYKNIQYITKASVNLSNLVTDVHILINKFKTYSND